MTARLTFRTDDEIDAALERLRKRSQASVSDVIRSAILDADKAARREEVRRWAEEQMADEAQVAETLRVNSEMQSHRAW